MSKSLVLVLLLCGCVPELEGLKPGKYLIDYQGYMGVCTNGHTSADQKDRFTEWTLYKNRDLWVLDLEGTSILYGAVNDGNLTFASQWDSEETDGTLTPVTIAYTIKYRDERVFDGRTFLAYTPSPYNLTCIVQSYVIGTMMD